MGCVRLFFITDIELLQGNKDGIGGNAETLSAFMLISIRIKSDVLCKSLKINLARPALTRLLGLQLFAPPRERSNANRKPI